MSAEKVLTKEYGVEFRFCLNNVCGIGNGDMYCVELNDEKDVLFFLLKTGFTQIEGSVIIPLMEKHYHLYNVPDLPDPAFKQHWYGYQVVYQT
jgi:hypothetical protein